MVVIYVVPNVDCQNGSFYVDYAVRDREGNSGIVSRSECFTDYYSAYSRLSVLRSLAQANSERYAKAV